MTNPKTEELAPFNPTAGYPKADVTVDDLVYFYRNVMKVDVTKNDIESLLANGDDLQHAPKSFNSLDVDRPLVLREQPTVKARRRRSKPKTPEHRRAIAEAQKEAWRRRKAK